MGHTRVGEDLRPDEVIELVLLIYFVSPILFGFVLFLFYKPETDIMHMPSILSPCISYIGILLVPVALLSLLSMGAATGHTSNSGFGGFLYLFCLLPPYFIFKLVKVWTKLSAAKLKRERVKSRINKK